MGLTPLPTTYFLPATRMRSRSMPSAAAQAPPPFAIISPTLCAMLPTDLAPTLETVPAMHTAGKPHARVPSRPTETLSRCRPGGWLSIRPRSQWKPLPDPVALEHELQQGQPAGEDADLLDVIVVRPRPPSETAEATGQAEVYACGNEQGVPTDMSWPVFIQNSNSPPMSPLSPPPSELEDYIPSFAPLKSRAATTIPVSTKTKAAYSDVSDPQPAQVGAQVAEKLTRSFASTSPASSPPPQPTCIRDSSPTLTGRPLDHKAKSSSNNNDDNNKPTTTSRARTRSRTGCIWLGNRVDDTTPSPTPEALPSGKFAKWTPSKNTTALYKAAVRLRKSGAPYPRIPEWLGISEAVGTVAIFEKGVKGCTEMLHPKEGGREAAGEAGSGRKLHAGGEVEAQQISRKLKTSGKVEGGTALNIEEGYTSSDEEGPNTLRLAVVCEGPPPESEYGHTLSGQELRYEDMLLEEADLDRDNPYQWLTMWNTERNKREGCMIDKPHMHAPPPKQEGNVEGEIVLDGRRESWVTWADEIETIFIRDEEEITGMSGRRCIDSGGMKERRGDGETEVKKMRMWTEVVEIQQTGYEDARFRDVEEHGQMQEKKEWDETEHSSNQEEYSENEPETAQSNTNLNTACCNMTRSLVLRQHRHEPDSHRERIGSDDISLPLLQSAAWQHNRVNPGPKQIRLEDNKTRSPTKGEKLDCRRCGRGNKFRAVVKGDPGNNEGRVGGSAGYKEARGASLTVDKFSSMVPGREGEGYGYRSGEDGDGQGGGDGNGGGDGYECEVEGEWESSDVDMGECDNYYDDAEEEDEEFLPEEVLGEDTSPAGDPGTSSPLLLRGLTALPGLQRNIQSSSITRIASKNAEEVDIDMDISSDSREGKAGHDDDNLVSSNLTNVSAKAHRLQFEQLLEEKSLVTYLTRAGHAMRSVELHATAITKSTTQQEGQGPDMEIIDDMGQGDPTRFSRGNNTASAAAEKDSSVHWGSAEVVRKGEGSDILLPARKKLKRVHSTINRVITDFSSESSDDERRAPKPSTTPPALRMGEDSPDTRGSIIPGLGRTNEARHQRRNDNNIVRTRTLARSEEEGEEERVNDDRFLQREAIFKLQKRKRGERGEIERVRQGRNREERRQKGMGSQRHEEQTKLDLCPKASLEIPSWITSMRKVPRTINGTIAPGGLRCGQATTTTATLVQMGKPVMVHASTNTEVGEHVISPPFLFEAATRGNPGVGENDDTDLYSDSDSHDVNTGGGNPN